MLTITLTADEVITVQAALDIYLANRERQAKEMREAGGTGGFFTRQANKAGALYDKIEDACCERR